jgi:FkbM family methyltransferase
VQFLDKKLTFKAMSKEVISFCINLISDSMYLLRGRLDRRQKAKVFFNYARFSLRYLLIYRLLRCSIGQEKFLGFTVKIFDYNLFYLVFREIFVRQIYYFDSNKRNPLIYDCGANIGLATVFFKFLYPASIVHCFEPDPKTFKLLKENVAINKFCDVHLHNVALYSEKNTKDLFVSRDCSGAVAMSILPGIFAKPKVIKVQAVLLSDYVSKPVDFLKMDLEGAEKEVLREMEKSGVIKMVQEIVFEYHHQIPGLKAGLGDVIGILEENGFTYQMHASFVPLYRKNFWQGVMVYAYQIGRESEMSQF